MRPPAEEDGVKDGHPAGLAPLRDIADLPGDLHPVRGEEIRPPLDEDGSGLRPQDGVHALQERRLPDTVRPQDREDLVGGREFERDIPDDRGGAPVVERHAVDVEDHRRYPPQEQVDEDRCAQKRREHGYREDVGSTMIRATVSEARRRSPPITQEPGIR